VVLKRIGAVASDTAAVFIPFAYQEAAANLMANAALAAVGANRGLGAK
jgi:hypothetical protein